MFGNLVESSSHTSEFARRGKFILGTVLSYSVLVVAGAVGSVYAYDAHLESQNLELVSLLSPVMPQEQQRVQPERPRTQAHSQPDQTPIRTVAISQIANNTKVPDAISTNSLTVPEVPDGRFKLGDQNIDPVGPAGPIADKGPAGGGQPHIEVGDPAPVKPEVKLEEKRTPVIISKGPVTGQAISLPKPNYPRIALDTNVRGSVKVQVLIDETGKVVSAQVLDGPALLRATSVQAAWQARFKPTTLGDVPVKVSGYIVYNFAQ